MVGALTVNEAEVALVATCTEVGASTLVTLLPIETVTAFGGAWFRVTVQVVCPLVVRLVDDDEPHCSAETTGATRLMEVLEETPLAVAVTVTV